MILLQAAISSVPTSLASTSAYSATELPNSDFVSNRTPKSNSISLTPDLNSTQTDIYTGGDKPSPNCESEAIVGERHKCDYNDSSELISINDNDNAKKLKPLPGSNGQRKVLNPLRNSVSEENGPVSTMSQKIKFFMRPSGSGQSQSLLPAVSQSLENKPPSDISVTKNKSQPTTTLVTKSVKPIYMKCRLPDGRVMLVMKKNAGQVLNPPGSVSLLSTPSQTASTWKTAGKVLTCSKWCSHLFLYCCKIWIK